MISKDKVELLKKFVVNTDDLIVIGSFIFASADLYSWQDTAHGLCIEMDGAIITVKDMKAVELDEIIDKIDGGKTNDN